MPVTTGEGRPLRCSRSNAVRRGPAPDSGARPSWRPRPPSGTPRSTSASPDATRSASGSWTSTRKPSSTSSPSNSHWNPRSPGSERTRVSHHVRQPGRRDFLPAGRLPRPRNSVRPIRRTRLRPTRHRLRFTLLPVANDGRFRPGPALDVLDSAVDRARQGRRRRRAGSVVPRPHVRHRLRPARLPAGGPFVQTALRSISPLALLEELRQPRAPIPARLGNGGDHGRKDLPAVRVGRAVGGAGSGGGVPAHLRLVAARMGVERPLEPLLSLRSRRRAGSDDSAGFDLGSVALRFPPQLLPHSRRVAPGPGRGRRLAVARRHPAAVLLRARRFSCTQLSHPPARAPRLRGPIGLHRSSGSPTRTWRPRYSSVASILATTFPATSIATAATICSRPSSASTCVGSASGPSSR